MSEAISGLTPQEQGLLSKLGRQVQEYLPTLTAGWKRALGDLTALCGEPVRKGVRRESLAAAGALLRALAEGQLSGAMQEARSYGETLALHGLGHAFLGQWLAALRQSLLTVLAQIHANDPQLDWAIVAFSKFFAGYMFQVTESFGSRQQRLLLEQQEALRQAYEEAQQRVVELEVLNEIGRAINSTMELDPLLRLIHQQAGRLMDTTNFFIALCDWEQGSLHLEFDQEDGTSRPRSSMSLSQGLTGYVARTGRSLFLPSGPEPLHEEQGIIPIGRPCKSWMGVPMISQERVIGVIAVQSYAQENVYNADHLRVLSMIASQAAVAVDNARLYQETRRRADEMEALYRIGASAARHMNLEEILLLIYEQASVVMDTSAFFVALYNRKQDEISFELLYDRGERKEPFRLKKSEGGGLTAWILDHAETLLLPDMDEAPAELKALVIYVGDPPRSWLSVPMVVRGEVIGVITAQSYVAGVFDEHHRQVLEIIAHQATAAIESTRLFQEAQRRVAQLSALQQVGVKLATTMDVSEILDAVAQAAMDLFHPGDVLIFLYDAAQDSFTLGTGLRDTGERGLFSPAPRRDGLTASVARTGKTMIVEDVPSHPLYRDDPDHALDMKSIVSVPLIRSDKVLGVLNACYRRPHRFSSEEMRLLQSFADQAAVAVYNAHLFQRMQAVAQEG